MTMSQSRNPRFHSNGVLKLGRVSRPLRRSERNTQGGTTFCLHVQVQNASAPGEANPCL